MFSKRVLNNEIEPDLYVPFTRHVDENTVATAAGGYLQILELEGVAYNTADVDYLNSLTSRLNNAIRNIADERIVIYTHTIRFKDDLHEPSKFGSHFSSTLDEAYTKNINSRVLYKNKIFVSIYIQPSGKLNNISNSKFANLFKSKNKVENPEIDKDLLFDLNDKTQQLEKYLTTYTPRKLGLVEEDAGYLSSQVAGVLRHIVSGVKGNVPLITGKLGSAIYNSRVVFARETVEIRHPASRTFGAILGIKEYPSKTRVNMFDGLLSAPFEFVFTNTFRFVLKAPTIEKAELKKGRLANAGNKTETSHKQIDKFVDGLQNGRYVSGDHCLSLLVFADSLKDLRNVTADAMTYLSDSGAVVTREDLGLESAFWGQLPGNQSMLARSGLIKSSNLAMMTPFHNHPLGKEAGNHWGSAVSKLKTIADVPYFFNFHIEDVGHTFICGPTGGGKTVIQMFLASQLEKFEAKRIIFDKDQGAKLYVLASDGIYLDLMDGKPTGCAPFKALELKSETETFFETLIVSMLQSGEKLTSDDTARIRKAVSGLYSIPQNERSVSVVKELLGFGDGSQSDIAVRLEAWCKDGPLGWVFDNDNDVISFENDLVGFDITTLLDNDVVRGPMMFYLLERIKEQINGQRIAIFIDEFWKALGDSIFQEYILNILKVLRKLNGFLVAGTQSPSDVINSPLARTIIEQCKTQMYFLSERASKEELVDYFGLTKREFTVIREELGIGTFLFKQGLNSVVCNLDLSGMDDELAVLSGTKKTVALAEQIISDLSTNGETIKATDWLPIFHKKRKELV